jgi:PAN domain
MHASLILAALAISSATSATPIARGNTCGSVPVGSGSAQPIAQPSGITTAQACQAACTSAASCQAFIFGLLNGVEKCMLYAVPAAQVPPQGTPNLVVYDKGCISVPAVVPTADSPTGAGTGSSGAGTPSGQVDSSVNKDQGKPRMAARGNQCNAAPTGPTGGSAPQPIATPGNIASLDACLAACKANPACKSCEFGQITAGGPKGCYLFAVPASSLPPPPTGASVAASDVGCSA